MIKLTEEAKEEFKRARAFHKKGFIELLKNHKEEFDDVLKFVNLAFDGDIAKDPEVRKAICDFFINETLENLHGVIQLAALMTLELLNEIDEDDHNEDRRV